MPSCPIESEADEDFKNIIDFGIFYTKHSSCRKLGFHRFAYQSLRRNQ
jgi:hypothetical protein